MNLMITLFQLILFLALLIAAAIITFRPKIFKPLENIIPISRGWRILQAIFLWIALIANLIGIAVPFIAFFASCIAIASSIPLVIRTVNLKFPKLLVLPILLIILSLIVGVAKPLGLKVIALPKADELPLNV